jgi:hypothetical protein
VKPPQRSETDLIFWLVRLIERLRGDDVYEWMIGKITVSREKSTPSLLSHNQMTCRLIESIYF